MRVLAVLYCYPPLLVPASICYLKVVAALRQQGVEVEILTITPESFDSPGPIPLDRTLETVEPEGVVQHRVDSPERSWGMRLLKRLDPRRRWLYRWLEPKKREWLGPARRRLDGLDLDRFDVLLTCSQPHANHLLGLDLAQRIGLPWVAYFSDPWTDNPYAGFASPAVLAHHRRLEDAVHTRADRVLFTCEEMRELVLSRHPVLDRARTGVLPHAFVPEWYGPRETGSGEGPVRLLQTGSFYGPRTPDPLLDALVRLGGATALESKLLIESYGGMDPRHQRRIEEEGLGPLLRTGGFIPYLQSLRHMRRSDVLVLVDAPLTSTEESVFLPSKLIDYLGSGTPILAATPESGATARALRECGGRVCALERPQELEAALASIIEHRGLDAPTDPSAAARYELPNVGRRLVEELEAARRTSPLRESTP